MKSKVDKIEWIFDSFSLFFLIVLKTAIFKNNIIRFIFFCLFR